MPLTAKVVPGETFPDGENVTRAKLRNAANPAVTIENTLSNGEVAADAGIALSKLEGVAASSIIMGHATTNNSSNSSLKAIAPVSIPTTGANQGGSINATTGITPSNNTVSHSSLLVNGETNIVRGADEMGYCTIGGSVNTTHRNKTACTGAGGTWTEEAVASNDVVLLCNVSQDDNSEQIGNDADNLRKVTVASLLKSTFSTSIALSDLTSSGALAASATKTIDFDANPVQAIACTTPSAGTGNQFTLTIKFSNLPSTTTTAKNIQVVLFNLSSTDYVNLSFDTPANGILRFIGSKPPTRLAAGTAAVMAVTGWPNNNVLIGYSAEVPA